MIEFMSVDIETTGLVPHIHKVRQFAAVHYKEGTARAFYRWLKCNNATWDIYCLSQTQWVRSVVAPEEFPDHPKICEHMSDLVADFNVWYDGHRITPAGKNFGSFDLQFLRLSGFPVEIFRHRAFDPTNFYLKLEDTVLPELATCKQRAGFGSEVSHDALPDAIDVMALICQGAGYPMPKSVEFDDGSVRSIVGGRLSPTAWELAQKTSF